jgi:regulator of extracellular matrix RemA (YlzA/DUF370 family)
MGMALVNVGFGNVVSTLRIIAIVSPTGAPMKRIRDEARVKNLLVDATEGRRTKSIIVTDSGHIVLSAFNPQTITQRITEGKGESDENQ